MPVVDPRACRPSPVLIAFAMALLLPACQKADEIRTYEVAKIETPPVAATADAPAVPSRMLGAVLFQGPQAWFFKMTGPDAAVQDQMEEFLAVVKSVRFENEKPKWDLPEGWSEQPGNQFRFATLAVDGSDPPLETSITVLPRDDGSDDEYLLANINRWRGQLQLPPTSADDLFQDKSGEEVIRDKTNAGVEVVLVNLAGQSSAGGGMTPPFAGNAPFARPTGPASNRPTAPTSTAGSDIKFNAPVGWQEAELRTFQVAAFRVTEGDQKVDISVTPLSGAAGGLLPNVNRWRGQIGLEPTDEQQLNAELQELPVGDQTAKFITIVGPEAADPQQAIWAAILTQGDATWFIKLQGDLSLAKKQQPQFEEFVKSLRFE